MSNRRLAVVVLAAGKGTRMKSARPKVLHPVAGRPMLAHVLDAVAALTPERIVVVVGAEMDAVAELARPHQVVVQDPALGTGHAVLQARAALDGYHGAAGAGEVLVVFADTPLLTPATLQRMLDARGGETAPALVGLAFRPEDPGAYGRVVCESSGRVIRIVEAADAADSERGIDLCNAGALLADGPVLFTLLQRCGRNNAKGEIYLTEVFARAREAGADARMVEADPEEVLGVNSRADLAVVEAVFQTRLRGRALAEGATLIDPSSVWFAADTEVGRDVLVEPNVVFGPGVSLADGVTIRAFSHIEGARVEPGAVIGPFARVRGGTRVGPEARIGNFVEVKNTELGAGAKANHLTYLGDTEVGEAANVGAGTITCNYDGFAKHRTVIGPGAFIGSNSALVAPVTVGPGAIVGAGSTIIEDVTPDAIATSRSPQRERKDAAKRYRERRATPGNPKHEEEKA